MFDSYFTSDHYYLLMALSSGVSSVVCPAARSSLKRLGYMTPTKVRDQYKNGSFMPYAMALRKKGQKRARAIHDQIVADKQVERLAHRRGPKYQPKKRSVQRARFVKPTVFFVFFDNIQ